MKAFRFTLQALSTVRQQREQAALEQYARALLERSQAVQQVGYAENVLRVAQGDWQGRVMVGCSAAEMSHWAEHCRDLATERDRRVEQLGLAERKTQAALQAMLSARQQREVVEKVRTRQRQVHQVARQRLEQKFLDELGQRRVELGLSSALNPSAL